MSLELTHGHTIYSSRLIVNCAPAIRTRSSPASSGRFPFGYMSKSSADVNSTGPDTPLVVATALDLTGCIKYLLKAGGDPNIPTDSDLLPIQIAACHGNRKVVEILFPFTAPIPIVSNWSVEGILVHVKAIHSKGKGKGKGVQRGKHTKAELNNCTKAELKLDGDKAVGRKDYLAASKLYTEAIGLDPNDATLYSNRSLCHVKMGEATKALFDANTCIMMQPEWLKGYYRKGAALMSLKEYKGACDAFLAGMKLDPNNADMETMFR
ncbi:hypothetical protein PR202_gb11411 [Eleusine coracana subsp. coracana]|uniref:Uncharacterized protein n=1 Tax=Eleusine coracana subsp. coracana TaxID=191504 RepID=A0AAV5EM08_ELECO|nr:hypothetical protein PR202_gb11411 [Eleusine coracana subsp. coracana]